MALEFTGERFIPWMEGAQIHYEHLHRYAFASQFVKGKKVLDLASGEGYGSSLLSKEADTVVGVDIDGNAVEHARNKYSTQNLEFLQGSILEIPIIGNNKFDVIVCFEVIEHVEEHEKLLSEVKRLLKKDGLFIVSSPNKKTYSDEISYNNPFHKKELYFNDFKNLLNKYFRSFIFFGQKVYDTSNIWLLPPIQYSNYKEFVIEKQKNEFHFSDVDKKIPLYFIAIASDRKLDQECYTNSNLFDASNILIGDAIQARDEQIKKFGAEIKRMVSEVETLQNINLNHHKTEAELSAALQARDTDNQKAKAEFCTALLAKDTQIAELTSTIQSMQQSIVWRAAIKYNLLLNKLLPHGTYPRKYYDIWLLWVKGIVNINNDFKKKNGNLKSFENRPKLLENNNNTLNTEIKNIIYQYSHNRIKSVDIICFPIINWDFRYQRPQQLLSRFAKNGYRVFYLTVESAPHEKAYLVKEIEKNILEINLSISSKFNVYKDILSQKQVDSLLKSLNEVKRDFKIDKALSFVEFPNWEPLVSKVKEKEDWKIIYDCMDEHTDFSNVNSSVSSKEIKLFKESDVIVVTSNHLLSKAKAYRNDIVFVPNAGDFDHFNKLPENTLLENIKKPIIGYFGAIAEWFDNELIEFLAENNKNWNFVLIGRTFGSNIKNLKTFPNVHFLGEKPYKELPDYLFWFDVCIIPFKLTPLIEATHPVKFYEYLSSGKPVVSSKLPELLKFSDICYIAENKEDFLEKIKIALKENDLEINNKRIKFAQDNTWDARYQMLISYIEQQLKIENIK
jgi:ubiquinone/menaquinone biosynthesis C-methylase UbiE